MTLPIRTIAATVAVLALVGALAALALAGALGALALAGALGPLALAGALGAGPPRAATAPARPLPPILFVRRVLPDRPGRVPGLGPHDRALALGGALLERGADGAIRDVLPGALRVFDVADPSVAPDARSVAFAACPRRGGRWRIWVTDLRTGVTHAVTGLAPEAAAVDSAARPGDAYDDLDPCWIAPDRLCFASTRGGGRAEYADVPVTNLYVVSARGGAPQRITAERNGADEPAFDPVRGRIVYARWWYNRWLPAAAAAGGLTLDRALAVPGDSVNVWLATEIDPQGRGLRLAAGGVRPRRGAMAYQPCVLPSGDVLGVYAQNTGLSPAGGALGVQRVPRDAGPSRRLAGALVDESSPSAYGTPRGLAPPAACAPAALPDGRVLLAYDAGGHGDFGIDVMDADGAHLTPVVDLPGTAELDPAPVVPWTSAALAAAARRAQEDATRAARVRSTDSTFTFFDRNLFAMGPLDSPFGPAPPIAWPARIRFYATRPARRAADVDTVVLVREAPVRPDGSVRESGLPADTPMFEQVVDARGRALASVHGTAHVAGFNFGRPGAEVRCVGCHAGHSTLAADGPDERFRWFDAARSAEVRVSSRMPGVGDAAALVDGATRGDGWRSVWCAEGDSTEEVTLTWTTPVRLRAAVLYAPMDARAGAAPRGRSNALAARIDRCTIVVSHKTEVLARRVVGPIGVRGTRVPMGDVLCDQLELRDFRVHGTVLGRPRVALAEIEAIAALAPEGLVEPAGPFPAPAARGAAPPRPPGGRR